MAGLVGSVLIFGVLAATVLGAVGTVASVTPIAGAPIEAVPRDGTFAVASKSTEGGFELLGIMWRQPTHRLEITAIVPIECVALDAAGQQQLNSGRECPSLPEGAAPAGGGITADGNGIVNARVDVLKACHDAIALGSPWPSALSECASD